MHPTSAIGPEDSTPIMSAAWAEPTFPDYPPTVGNAVADAAGSWGDHQFVVTPDDALTYAQLDRRSRHLAARLVEAGVPVVTLTPRNRAPGPKCNGEWDHHDSSLSGTYEEWEERLVYPDRC